MAPPTQRRQHWMNVLFPGSVDFPGNTEGIIAPSGLTAERPSSPARGTIRYNTSNNTLEAYIINAWEVIGTSGTGGVTAFLGLSDTPGTYPIGSPIMRVNAGQTGVEFIDGSTLFLALTGGTMNPGQHITMAGGTIKGVPSPAFNNDVANKQYVDGIAAGFSAKESVHSASVGANLPLSGLAGIDGHAAYNPGDRVLAKDQTNTAENGIYDVVAGAWTRSSDMDGSPANEVQGGTTTYVQAGTVNGNTNWVVINPGVVVVGTDAMNWSIVSAGSTQNLWESIQDDSAAVITATGPTETFTIAGGTAITTVVAGTTLTITNNFPNIVQDTFKNIQSDIGMVVATGDANTLSIVGGTDISTSVAGSVLTIKSTATSLQNIVEDVTPQLGGNLDVQAFTINSSTPNASIVITPNGAGNVVLDGLNWPNSDGTVGQVLTTDGGGNLSFITVSGGGGSRINDADDNTYVEVEQGADDNTIRMAIEGDANHFGGELLNFSLSNGINIGKFSFFGTGPLDGTVGAGQVGVPIDILSGQGSSTDQSISGGQTGGGVDIGSGRGGSGYWNGSVSLDPGDGGAINISAGGAGNINGVSPNYYQGTGNGGSVNIGGGGGAGYGSGGGINLAAGDGDSGDGGGGYGGRGGSITIVSGKGFATKFGGDISITAGYGGNGAGARGGKIDITSGDSSGAGIPGSDVTIKTGRGNSAGGNIVLAPAFSSSQGAVLITSSVVSATVSTELRFQEGTNNGSNSVALKAPDLITTDQVWILPDVAQASTQMLGIDLGEFTIANLPAAATYPNCYAMATDASGGRTIVRSDGTNWKIVVVEGATVA